jgi:hypothetical protein
MDAGNMRLGGRRVVLALVCLVIAPTLGLWAGGSMPNPPGNGPGTGQLLVGIVLPVLLTSLAAHLLRIRRIEGGVWTVASLAMTGVLVLVWFVRTYLPT